MSRREFNRSTRLAIIARASINGIPTCERIDGGTRCGCTKGLEINHISMDAMTLDKSRVLAPEDGELICKAHHNVETRMQVADLAKARAQEAAHLGAKPPPSAPIVSKGFAKVSKRDKPPLRVAEGVPNLMRRFRTI